jgi:hypothetical protein
MKEIVCSVCGRTLESYDSFTIRFKPKETTVCSDCDVDLNVRQKDNEE